MASGRQSPTGTLGGLSRGDGTLTPTINGESPISPFFVGNHQIPLHHASSMSNLRMSASNGSINKEHDLLPQRSSASIRGSRNHSNVRSDTPGGMSASDSVGGSTRRAGSTRERARSGRATPGQNDTSVVPSTPAHRTRMLPQMPHDNIEAAPAVHMYWSQAPVWGTMPNHGMRAHSVTLVDNVAWIFGGCDERGCWKDVWLLNTETMQWSHPEMRGNIPPPCRAHTATLVDRKIVIFGGGEGATYYNSVYVLDTVTRTWTNPQFPPNDPHPSTRRAHTAVLYNNKIWFFGGGNGFHALNDIWTLSVGVPIDKMRWEEVKVEGTIPTPRGYHTANLIGNFMIVLGGSDGTECFSDIWCFNLDTLKWSQVRFTSATSHRRLSHSVTQVGSYLLVVGGHDGTTYNSDLLFFNLVSLSFEDRPIAGTAPTPRGYHISILSDSRLFVFGGFNGQDVFDEVHVLDLAGSAYLAQVTSFKVEIESCSV